LALKQVFASGPAAIGREPMFGGSGDWIFGGVKAEQSFAKSGWGWRGAKPAYRLLLGHDA
jgi:hypothetical protein